MLVSSNSLEQGQVGWEAMIEMNVRAASPTHGGMVQTIRSNKEWFTATAELSNQSQTGS